MKIYLIRHGKTAGNLKGRYIGRTDESLCVTGREELKKRRYPEADLIFVSPMKRCIETAKILYPGRTYLQIEELRETDFGIFEGHTYQELFGNKLYQEWIDSGGTMPFPEGESRENVRRRCIEGFQKVLRISSEEKAKKIVLIVHGGTIMHLMEEYAVPKGDYYDFQIKNGEGFLLEMSSENEKVFANRGKNLV